MFFEFGIKDIVDIVLVALMLFYIYRLMRESRSLNVFYGILVFVLVWLFVSQVLEMKLLGSILDKLVSVGVIGLIVLFQEEIRHFLYNLGAHQKAKNLIRWFRGSTEQEADKESIMPIVMACMNMARGKVGALIASLVFFAFALVVFIGAGLPKEGIPYSPFNVPMALVLSIWGAILPGHEVISAARGGGEYAKLSTGMRIVRVVLRVVESLVVGFCILMVVAIAEGLANPVSA